MNVCMLVSAPLPPREGIGYYVWNLSCQLTQLGHQVTIITRGGLRRRSMEMIEGIRVYQLPYVPVFPFHVHFHAVFVDRLIREIEGQFDILHLHSPLVRYPSTKLDSIVTIHSPIIANSRSMKGKNIFEILYRLQAPVSITLERGVLGKTSSVTSVARSVAEELEEYGIPLDQVRVMANGVDTGLFSPSIQTDRVDKRYLLTVGRLEPRKGINILLESARIVLGKHPDLEFWIAGSGPNEIRLRSQAKSLGLGALVRFLGHVSDRAEMVRLYQNATGYVHSSIHEGLPTVILEAMACGTPVVSTTVGGALDVIEDGVNGLHVPAGDPVALAEGIDSLLEDPILRDSFGKAGRETIRERYSWLKITQNYLDLYEETCRQGVF